MRATDSEPASPLTQEKVAALTVDDCPRMQCEEPREQQSVPYQLHKFQSWAAQDYHSLREAERRQRLRDTALCNCIILLQKDLKSLLTRVRFLEENYRDLRDKYYKVTEETQVPACKVNGNSV